MSEVFDPYRKWFGIPPEEQPPHCYRLLGIGLFESDPDVISHAADRQMAHIRTFQTGRYAKLSQQLLNELSTARVCLLDPQRKAVYDAQLRWLGFIGPNEQPSLSSPSEPHFFGTDLFAPSEPTFPQLVQPVSPPVGKPVFDFDTLPSAAGPSRYVRPRTSSSSASWVIGGLVAGVVVAALAVVMVLKSKSSDLRDTDFKIPPTTKKPVEAAPDKTPKVPPPVVPPPQPDLGKSPTPTQPPPKVEPVIPDLPKPEPPKQNSTGAYNRAHVLLGQRNPAKAKSFLDEALAANPGEDRAPRLQRLAKLCEYSQLFWDGVRKCTLKLKSGDEVQADGKHYLTQVDPVSKIATFQLNGAAIPSRISELPGPLAVELARKVLADQPDFKLALATFHTVDQAGNRQEAQRLWTEASASRKDLDPLLRELRRYGAGSTFNESGNASATSNLDPPTTPVGKPPIPDADTLRPFAAQHRAAIREEWNKTKVRADRQALVKKISQQAKDAVGDVNQRYFFLKEARDLSVEILDAEAFLAIIDELATTFECEPLELKTLAFYDASNLAAKPEEYLGLLPFAEKFILQCAAQERYELASRTARAAIAATNKAKAFTATKKFDALLQQVEAAEKERQRSEAALQTLAEKLDDTAANQARGSYLCFTRGDWPAGLPFLAKAADAELKKAAELDVANSTTPTTQVEVGQLWLNLSKKYGGLRRTEILKRAQHWYNLALPNLSETARADAEPRVAEILRLLGS